MNILTKIWHKVVRFCFQPIQVYVFHTTGDTYNPLIAWECDWTQIDLLKSNIEKLQRDHEFISLDEAWKKLKNDRFRFKKYAVLTSDDGYLALRHFLPWLERKNIPITLFVNPAYMDKKSWSCVSEEQARKADSNIDMHDIVGDLYLSDSQIWNLQSDNISIGMHGWEHNDALSLSKKEFEFNVDKCMEVLGKHPRFIPFYAYTWGHHNSVTDMVLEERGIVPVLVNGGANLKYNGFIDRVCIDGKSL